MARTLPPGMSPLDFDEFEVDESLLPDETPDIELEIDQAFIDSLDICDVHHEPRCFCACNHPGARNR